MVILFYCLLEEVMEDAVYTGTKRAMAEMLEHIDDMMPEEITEEDSERIAALYNSEPAGRA